MAETKSEEVKIDYVDDRDLPETPAGTSNNNGATSFTQTRNIVIGAGDNAFYSNSQGIYLGSEHFSTAPFRVNMLGALTATSATITGSITATTGAIGGWEIGADYIRDVANSFGLASTVTAGDDIRIWGGDTFANRASADFYITESGQALFKYVTISGGSNVKFISDTIDSESKFILKDFTFGATDYSGAFKTGDIT